MDATPTPSMRGKINEVDGEDRKLAKGMIAEDSIVTLLGNGEGEIMKGACRAAAMDGE
jgi:hypothetical protein